MKKKLSEIEKQRKMEETKYNKFINAEAKLNEGELDKEKKIEEKKEDINNKDNNNTNKDKNNKNDINNNKKEKGSNTIDQLKKKWNDVKK